jgi:hypothetical protein
MPIYLTAQQQQAPILCRAAPRRHTVAARRGAGGHRGGATQTPWSLELQARYWLALLETIEGLNEAATAVADWRAANTVASCSSALAVMADRLASLAPSVHDRVQTIINLSPTLRAAMRQIEARQAQHFMPSGERLEGGAA